MGKWKKQSMLMKHSSGVSDRVSRLIEWSADLSEDRLRKCTQSAFRTLNNPNRYKYFWQEDTRTHEKYLTFLACLNEQCNRHGGNMYDWEYELVNSIEMNRSKGWLTMYYVIMLYLKHRDVLYEFDLKFNRTDAESLLVNAKNGGYEFKDVDYYTYKDNIDALLGDSNRGSVIMEIEERRSKSDKPKTKKGKRKKMPILLTEW